MIDRRRKKPTTPKKYSSSLTDQEWSIVEPILLDELPKKALRRPLEWSYRELLDGMLYQLKNGCTWADLPNDLPPSSTVYWHYQQWEESGVLKRVRDTLHGQLRKAKKKQPNWTSLLLIDSQAVKNTCRAGHDSNGFCFYKATNGIKRHLAVDSLGFPFFLHCTPANVTDDQGLLEMLIANRGFFQAKPADAPKMTILLDHGYSPDKLIEALQQQAPEIANVVEFQLSPKMSKAEKEEKGLKGFVVEKARWVVERSNAWVEQCRNLLKNLERTVEHATAKLDLCFLRLLTKRLALYEAKHDEILFK